MAAITLRKVEEQPPMMMALSLSMNRVFDFASLGNPAAAIDSDWDGTSDLDELLAGTDELNPACFFAARCLQPSPTGLCITWPSVAGKRYALYRAAAIDGEYQLVAHDLEATPPQNAYADCGTGTGAGFYQIAAY